MTVTNPTIREIITLAEQWLQTNGFIIGPDNSPPEIVRGIETFYPGGLFAFLSEASTP